MITARSDIPEHMRIFASRFIGQLDRAGHGLRRKSQLVAQKCADQDSTAIATKAPKVHRFSQRILLSLAASLDGMEMFTRDVTQVSIQSDTPLESHVYIAAPAEMKLPPDTVLKVVHPLYGISESGLHWYQTYSNHHIDHMNMFRTTIDPCVLVQHSGKKLTGLVILQVDDWMGIGTPNFLSE